MDARYETQSWAQGKTRERLITIMLDTNHPEFREDAVVPFTPAGVLIGPVVGDDLDDFAYAT